MQEKNTGRKAGRQFSRSKFADPTAAERNSAGKCSSSYHYKKLIKSALVTTFHIFIKMVFKGGALAIAVLALALHCSTVSAVKDDAFIAYLNGTNVATLGIKTLDGVTVSSVSFTS